MEISKTKRTYILIASIVLMSLITFSARFIAGISVFPVRIILNIMLNVLMGVIAIVAMKLTKMKTEFGLKNAKSYIIGIVIALGLILVMGLIPIWCGTSLCGGHIDFVLWNFIFSLFYYLLIIGPVEELIFRVYIQETIEVYFNKNKWVSVIIAAALFGIWHIINGTLIQVIFAFVIGLVFGFCKYYIKNCKYVGVALGHGLYDFLLYVLRVVVL